MSFFDILLAKKLSGGGGGDVTIEQLDVTENGTYSETGKAYSPVNVNIPVTGTLVMHDTLPNYLMKFELKVKISEGVENLANSLFEYSSSLKFTPILIDLPTSLKKISTACFKQAHDVNIIIRATIPPVLSSNAFTQAYNYKIFVPSESLNDYKNAEYWSDIAQYIEAIPQ